ncbi:D-3-phosphoglycerate dehydrogenase [Azospirillum sp. B510]|uniref:hydroxyacid dehydrogenase n=1 Tax=Azospirillum sp. (strain B510) TaxID=137722 RepID=UPI0001C4BDFB|nr:hydroxyacid dehydrogenase [Azospirillum sp. B510]BAI71130.1 D-3-phosphoglycerate dehydrogenase [Azospirillum sp. B510]
MPDIIISEFMQPSAVDELRRDFDVHYDETLYRRLDELYAMGADARAICIRNETEIRGAFFDAFPNLKAVGRLGVGLDNIDVPACRQRGVAVLPATGANEVSVAELAIAGLMMLVRGTTYFATPDVVAGKWPRGRLIGREVSGRTLGIVGFGRIGRLVARRAQGLDMTVIAADPHVPADDPVWARTGVEKVSFDRLWETADALSLHLPYTPETHDLVNAGVIARLKPGSILVNVARGGIVDEAALAAALKSGHLGGALLDVYATEPLPADNPFHGVPNLILTPHIGATTDEARIRTGHMIADNVRAVLTGSIPDTAII